MNPERWQQIERIFEEALGREGPEREAFLTDASAGDVELRREVEGLLAAHHQAKGLTDTPALEQAAKELAGQTPSLLGPELGSYKILSLPGKGGMVGEVYLAEDTTLERQVAIKVLPEPGEMARKRFLRETKSATAIDHPFICSIHELERSEGHDFIVME